MQQPKVGKLVVAFSPVNHKRWFISNRLKKKFKIPAWEQFSSRTLKNTTATTITTTTTD